MAHYFISDIHLGLTQDEFPALQLLFDKFLDFLISPSAHAESLYLLGDIFAYWIGDDYQTAITRHVAKRLNACKHQHDIPLYFLHGNRDFLVGKQYLQAMGCQLLDDPSTILLDNEPVVLSHGDMLCTRDVAYQRFRRRVRNPIVQWLFSWKSIEGRLKTAKRYRQASNEATKTKPMEVMEIDEVAVKNLLQQNHTHRLIHGHTHQPARHHIVLDENQTGERIVLGDWHDHNAMILRYDNKTFELIDIASLLV